jgi:hypothetical protein
MSSIYSELRDERILLNLIETYGDSGSVIPSTRFRVRCVSRFCRDEDTVSISSPVGFPLDVLFCAEIAMYTLPRHRCSDLGLVITVECET